MPYERSIDAYQGANNSSSGRRVDLITPGTPLTTYPKALRVFSAAGCTLTVVPVDAILDTDTVVLEFPEGLAYEPLVVRAVNSATGSPTIHGYTK